MALQHANVYGSVYAKVKRRIAGTIIAVSALSGPAESDMKQNAPWTDRTALARNGLNATVAVVNTPQETRIALRLAHRMEYGTWLELANAGKYAIVGPTTVFYRQKVAKAINTIWGKPLA